MKSVFFTIFLFFDIVSLFIVGSKIGFLYTFVWRIIAFGFGVMLIKNIGFSALFNIKSFLSLESSQEYILDKTLVCLAGFSLISLGFLSDIVFLFLIFPFTRGILIKILFYKFNFLIKNKPSKGIVIDVEVEENDDFNKK